MRNALVIGQFSLCAITLALVTVWLNHRLAHGRDKLKRIQERGLALAETFKPELAALLLTDTDCRLVLTDDAYRRHESAVREFLPYHSWVDKFRIRNAWSKFAHFKIDRSQSIPFNANYADCDSLDKRRQARPWEIKDIQKIMSYAQQ